MNRTEYLTVPWETWRDGRADRERIATRQRRRVEETVAFVRRNSRFYRRRYADLPDDAGLSQLPPVTKREVMANVEDVVTDTAITEDGLDAFLADESNVGRLFLGEYPVWTTAGTTGEPGVFVQDRRALTAMLSVGGLRILPEWFSRETLRKYLRNGGRRALVASSSGHYAAASGVRLGRRLVPPAADRLRLLSVEQPLSSLVAELNDYQPAMLGGYATAHRLLAREQREGRLDIDPALVVPSGETISDREKAEIADAFDCEVREHYGATEFLALAFECPEGNLHANTDWAVLEPVDSEYRPVPPGEPSERVLLTNLANRVQPLVRYELGDSIALLEEFCSCGSPLPVMEVEGRTDDVLFLRDESGAEVPVFPLAIGSVVEEVAGVYRFQILQTGPSEIRVRLETEADAGAGGQHAATDDAAVWERVEADLSAFLDAQGVPSIAVERADEPPERESSGKFRQVFSAV